MEKNIIENNKKNNKKLVTDIVLYAAFPVICIIFGLLGKWILFGVALFLYLAVFTYLKMESIYLILAGFHDKKNEHINALKFAYKAYRIKTSTIDTFNIFIYMLLKAGKYEKALEVINESQLKPMTEDQHIAYYSNKALALWKSGDINGAVSIFDELTKDYESTAIYVSFGTILTFSNDLQKALDINRKAIQYNSTSKGITDNLAYTYFLIGDKDRAKRMYDDLIDEQVSFPEAYYNAAMVDNALGQHESAVRLLKQALTKQFNGLSAVSPETVQSKIDYLNRGQGMTE